MNRSEKCLLFLLITIAVFGTVSCVAESASGLQPEGEWIWEAEGVWTLTGRFVFSGDNTQGAVWHLELNTNQPESQGELAFSEINGEHIKVRKRSDTLNAEVLGEGAENTFTALWNLTEVPVDLSAADIQFVLSDEGGNPLVRLEWSGKATQNTEAERDAVSRAGSMLRVVRDALLVTAGMAWFAAVLRTLIRKRKGKRHETGTLR